MEDEVDIPSDGKLPFTVFHFQNLYKHVHVTEETVTLLLLVKVL